MPKSLSQTYLSMDSLLESMERQCEEVGGSKKELDIKPLLLKQPHWEVLHGLMVPVGHSKGSHCL